MPDPDPDDRTFAIAFNQQAWALLGKAERTAEEDRLMVHAAHASLLHWLATGTRVHEQRGLWLIARVYAELGIVGEAMRHAQACAALTEQVRGELQPFDLAYAEEAVARAHAVAGDAESAATHRARAEELAAAISAEADRKLALEDIAAGNWGVLAAPR
jgi:hypothetical protein